MANQETPDGDRRSTDVLFSSPGAKESASQPPPEQSEFLAEIRTLGERVDALVDELRQLNFAEERAERDALAAERRSRLDESSAEWKQANEKMLRLPAEVEAAVRASLGERADEDIAHRLKVAETSLVGLSDTVRGVDRRLSERLEPIERTATSIDESARALEVTARKLDEVAEKNARLLPTIEETRKTLGKLELMSGIGFFFVLSILALLGFAIEKRARLFSELFGLW